MNLRQIFHAGFFCKFLAQHKFLVGPIQFCWACVAGIRDGDPVRAEDVSDDGPMWNPNVTVVTQTS